MRVSIPSDSLQNLAKSTSAMKQSSIEAAVLLSCKTYTVPGQLLVDELFLRVPLDYTNSSSPRSITLFARRVNRYENPVAGNDQPPIPKPYMVYLEGGPGFGNKEPQDHVLTRHALAKGYQLLLLDHRGTGMSTPVSAKMLEQIAGKETESQVSYLKLMRQDNTVRDCEAVRKCLTKGWPKSQSTWSIFGQSYGGFISLSYLSMHPEGLREVFLTGGLAPVGRSADEVYARTFQRTVKRNEQYFNKFPDDVTTLHQIVQYIDSQGGSVQLPAGGFLTVPRLLTIGIAFGVHGGFNNVHSVLLSLKTSLDQYGFFTRSALFNVESCSSFDENIIYAILHEAIYCDGPGSASNWAAQRVGQSMDAFRWLRPGQSMFSTSEKPLYFSGEMIFPLHLHTYPELQLLAEVANKVALVKDWPPLYDREQLSKNEIPVYAASYVEDMYVDYDFARETANLCKGVKTFETNVMYHNALRAKSDEVMQQLFALRDDIID